MGSGKEFEETPDAVFEWLPPISAYPCMPQEWARIAPAPEVPFQNDPEH